MYWRDPPFTEEQRMINALQNQLSVLQSRHDTLGVGYRNACAELEKLRKENEVLKAKLTAVRVLCEATP